MKPYYHDEKAGITIYNGDCRDVLPWLESESVDLILSDPPYGINYVTSWRSRNDKLRKPIANDSTLQLMQESWPDMMRILDDDRHWYMFASPRMLPEAMSITQPKQVLAWTKGNSGTVGDLECGFGENWEAICYGMKGRRKLRGSRPRTVVECPWSGARDPLHPTVKPVNLLKRLICWSTDTGETVIDPCMGSGTALRAAKDTGRRAIGIETELRYVDIAVQRLRQEVLFT